MYVESDFDYLEITYTKLQMNLKKLLKPTFVHFRKFALNLHHSLRKYIFVHIIHFGFASKRKLKEFSFDVHSGRERNNEITTL